MADKWGAGVLMCLSCDDEHMGAWLIGSEPVECPKCGNMSCVSQDGLGFGEAQILDEIRERIIASGQPLLSWEDIDRELAKRRGGV